MPRNRPSIERVWRQRGLLAWLLLPVAMVFLIAAFVRRLLYRAGVLPAVRLPVPVVIVGGITVGGSGKTPLVLWLVAELARRGKRPGVVSRGYRGKFDGVREVAPDDAAAVVGDEPLLIRRRGNCPVFISRKRVDAARVLLAKYNCDVIVCDDGLQHYQLMRDVEIAVLDRRGALNGLPLPAGPLREPLSRLSEVDAVVANGWSGPAAFRMTVSGSRFQRQDDPAASCVAADLAGMRLHAVAGIGEPHRFFEQLQGLGLRFEAHAFPDHYHYVAGDLDFEGAAILTTEKDAVKLDGLSRLPVWVLPVTATVEPDLALFVMEKIHGLPAA